MRIFASLLSVADHDIERFITRLNECVHGFHIDIMDKTFVPYEAGSLEQIATIRKLSPLPLWIHLMVNDPLRWISQLNFQPGDIVSVHYEVYADALERLQTDLVAICQRGGTASLAFSPFTSLAYLNRVIDCVEHVLIMGVVPGKPGQPMLHNIRSRLEEVHNMRSSTGGNFMIGLDGGVNVLSLRQTKPYFPEIIAVGSSLVNTQNPCCLVKDFCSITSPVQYSNE